MSIDLFGQESAQRRAFEGAGPRLDSGSDEWLTPPNIIDSLGAFDLDPCSPGERRPWDTAAQHYGIEDDGLRQDWSGRVWMNPPYASAGAWMRRLAGHGHGTALLFARTETRMWFECIWPEATGLLFLKGRIKFRYVSGKEAGTAAAPSVLIAYGVLDAAALRKSSLVGHYVDLRNPT